MNPNKLELSDQEKKEVVKNYFMSDQKVAEEVKKAEVLKWLQKNIAISKLNPTAIKYGIDSITMLKTREELKTTMLKIEEIRAKYNINYIDSRTSDALIKMEDALGTVDFKDIFNNWARLESFTPGVDNLLYLVTSSEIENFKFTFNNGGVEEEELELEFDDEEAPPANANIWRIKRVYDDNGVPILNSNGTFNVVSETGEETTITREALITMLFSTYF
jgi:hypothetical protein